MRLHPIECHDIVMASLKRQADPGRTPPAYRASHSKGRVEEELQGPGTTFGLHTHRVKNALDYTEELKTDRRPYLEGRAVGCIVTTAGEQGAVTTLIALRSVVHTLRGWPTPLGAAIVTSNEVFDAAGNCLSPRVEMQLKIISQQVFDFASVQMEKIGQFENHARTGLAFG
jgi:FMN reductase